MELTDNTTEVHKGEYINIYTDQRPCYWTYKFEQDTNALQVWLLTNSLFFDVLQTAQTCSTISYCLGKICHCNMNRNFFRFLWNEKLAILISRKNILS